MTTVVSGRRPVLTSIGSVCCVLLTAFCLLSCSVPNLGEPDCEEARDSVREFYSWYLATPADDRGKSPDVFEKYATQSMQRSGDIDPFFLTNDPPKAFRVGDCKVIEKGKRTQFELLLFWKDDVRSEQRSIKVGMDNVDGKWLIHEVTP